MPELSIQVILGIIGVILTLIGYFFYIRDTLSGKTTPHIYSWIIWGSLTLIAFFIQIQDNAGPGAWITGTSAVVSFFIAFLAFIKKGNKNISSSDTFSFIGAIIATIFWLILENPLISVLLITIIDALGFYPTFRKTFHKPHEETLIHYFLAGFKFIIAIAALTNFSTLTVLYPLSLVIMNFAFIAMVVMRKRHIKQSIK